jgi:hypothetical protein
MSTSPFVKQLKEEVGPLVIHIAAVLTLEAGVLLVGVALVVLQNLFPEQQARFAFIEQVDMWSALVLLCLFAVYTVVLLSIRFYKGLRLAWVA